MAKKEKSAGGLGADVDNDDVVVYENEVEEEE